MNTQTPHLHYRLLPADLSGHRFQITLTIAQPDPEGQVVSLPAWIPGSYLIRDFARQVETLSARSGRRALSVEKLDSQRWRIAPCKGTLVIEYTVYAWDLSVRSAHLDETHGFFNGTSVFLQPHGLEHLPCLLDIRPPEQHSDWSVHTSLPEATGLPGAAVRHGFGLYRAPDYDALIDHPVEMGTPQVITFQAHGAEHELVFTGVIPNLDLSRVAADVRAICEAQIAFFEPESKRAPFLDSAERYVFMTMVTGSDYGGLEHRASTALMASRSDLPVFGDRRQSEGYRTFLGLVSHEYFHTWHVKRIKPAAFAPYDLARENHTRLLWVFEGFTSYYDDLFLVRTGLITETQHLEMIAKTINQVLAGPGRLKQSIAQSSFDAWTRFYKQDENSPNAIVSYYAKGALAALGLDLTIRQATNNSRSLDDVMALLWQRYGRDFYARDPQARNGLPEAAMPALIQEATGVDVGAAIAAWVEGTADVPLAELLAPQGIRVESKRPEHAAPVLGATTRKQGSDLVLRTVYEQGPAHEAGLSAGDVLVAIDGLRVTADSKLDELLSRYQSGQTVTLHVFRRDELRRFALALAAAPVAVKLSRTE